MHVLEMARQDGFILKQVSATSTLPGLVPVRGLVGLPPLVIHKGHVTEVAGVTVL